MCNFSELYKKTIEVLKNNTIKSNINRVSASGFNYAILHKSGRMRSIGNPCKSETYGIVKKMVIKKGENPYQPAVNNTKKPIVYECLKNLIKNIAPDFEYTSITLNFNFKCLPHKDKGNKKESLIIGLGDYTGGELVVEGVEFDIKEQALIFNGGELEHYVNEFDGNRWTIVYY
jgi:hypothetical protein